MRSMTGFGKASVSLDEYQRCYDIEILAVNRRQLELRLNIPPEFNALDQDIRSLAAGAISRGAVSIKISSHDNGGSTLNVEALRQVAEKCLHLRAQLGLPLDVNIETLLTSREVYNTDGLSINTEQVWPILRDAIAAALDKFNQMRTIEGENLKTDLIERLKVLEEVVEELKIKTKELPLNQRAKLLEKLEQAGLPVDLSDERLLKEILFYADKCDVSEELTRLASHFVQFKGFLSGEENCGRSLDFLIQEIFREINTLGNKSGSCNVSPLVVKFKSELEKIREQVQNIE